MMKCSGARSDQTSVDALIAFVFILVGVAANKNDIAEIEG